MNILKHQKGYSLLELLIIFSIIAIIITLASANLMGATRRTVKSTNFSTLVSDLKSQQVKAMNGDTEGASSNNNYGIYFESNKYTLFRGNSYSPSDTHNFTINLPTGTELSDITFNNSLILFAAGSGEFISFNNTKNSLKIKNTTDGSTKGLIINKFGTITTN
jgi:type II secretory pathway pseudopilin PulG